MRVKHYPRVSSKAQADKGDSVEFQDKRLMEDSKQKGDEVVEVITDAGKSASLSDENFEIRHKDGFVYVIIDIRKRDGMNKVLDSLKDTNWEALKITKWDRFSRNNIFSKLMKIYFERNNKKIIPVDDSNDPLLVGIKDVLSEEEVRKMTGRVRDVRKMRFEKGMMVARPPLGYKLNKVKKTIEIDTPKAKLIQKVFEMASEGDDYKTICAICNLAPQQVYNIIRNKTYMGIITFEGVEKVGTHEPLVTKEIWDKANHV